MHAQRECFLNGGFGDDILSSDEMKLFSAFLPSTPPVIAYRTEWAIFGEEARFAGTIDFVAKP